MKNAFRLPRVKAVIVALQGNPAIAKMKEYCERGLHLCAGGERSKRYGEDSSPPSLDSYAVVLRYRRDDLVLLPLENL